MIPGFLSNLALAGLRSGVDRGPLPPAEIVTYGDLLLKARTDRLAGKGVSVVDGLPKVEAKPAAGATVVTLLTILGAGG